MEGDLLGQDRVGTNLVLKNAVLESWEGKAKWSANLSQG